MSTLKRLRWAVGLVMLRLLVSRYGVSVLLATMLLGAAATARYLDQSPRQVVPHTTTGGGGPSTSCGAPDYAAFAYNPDTNQFYCVPYPN
jgi:hypothetical protein